MNIENQLIVKYLLHQLTEEESATVEQWLRSDPSNQDFLFCLEELYWANQMEELQRMADTHQEWKKLESQIVFTDEKSKSKNIFRWSFLIRYAAVAIVAVSLSL